MRVGSRTLTAVPRYKHVEQGHLPETVLVTYTGTFAAEQDKWVYVWLEDDPGCIRSEGKCSCSPKRPRTTMSTDARQYFRRVRRNKRALRISSPHRSVARFAILRHLFTTPGAGRCQTDLIPHVRLIWPNNVCAGVVCYKDGHIRATARTRSRPR